MSSWPLTQRRLFRWFKAGLERCPVKCACTQHSDHPVPGSRKKKWFPTEETQSHNFFQRSRAPPGSILFPLFERHAFGASEIQQFLTPRQQPKQGCPRTVTACDHRRWLVFLFVRKVEEARSKVWPRPTKCIYSCAAPLLSFKSPAIPPCIPNIIIWKVSKRNWDLAYLQCCDRQVCRKPVYNIALDTNGSSTRQAVCESWSPALHAFPCERQSMLKWPMHHHFAHRHPQQHRKYSRQWICWGNQHQKFTWPWRVIKLSLQSRQNTIL